MVTKTYLKLTFLPTYATVVTVVTVWTVATVVTVVDISYSSDRIDSSDQQTFFVKQKITIFFPQKKSYLPPKKSQNVTILKILQNSKCDKRQILKMWQNSECDKTQSVTKHTKNVTMHKNSKCDKI